MQDIKKLKKIAYNLLLEIGENPKRVGLKDTPKRMARMWTEIFKGYNPAQLPIITVFPNNQDGVKYDQIIIDQGTFHSYCEHHMALFKGQYYFGYIPNQSLIGLSKIARIIEYYSSRLQIQERLGQNIVDYIETKIKPKGMILVLKANHSCKETRGVKQSGVMITSIVKGVFEIDISAKEEFFNMIKL